MSLRSSGVGGIEATTLPSFLAASRILSHSAGRNCGLCADNDETLKSAKANDANDDSFFMFPLTNEKSLDSPEQFLCQLHSRFAIFEDDLFRAVLQLIELFRCKNFLGRRVTELS